MDMVLEISSDITSTILVYVNMYADVCRHCGIAPISLSTESCKSLYSSEFRRVCNDIDVVYEAERTEDVEALAEKVAREQRAE